jgi:hypothetical protein
LGSTGNVLRGDTLNSVSQLFTNVIHAAITKAAPAPGTLAAASAAIRSVPKNRAPDLQLLSTLCARPIDLREARMMTDPLASYLQATVAQRAAELEGLTELARLMKTIAQLIASEVDWAAPAGALREAGHAPR